MEKIQHKIQKHISTHAFLHSIIGAGIVFAILTPIVALGHYSFKYWSPRSVWFEYEKVVPAKKAFDKGEILQFNSFGEIYRHGKIQWFDSLYCFDGEFISKYQTQVFPYDSAEPVSPKILGLEHDETWHYSAEPLYGHEIECHICGNIIFLTPQFDVEKKQDWGCTDSFKVNQ